MSKLALLLDERSKQFVKTDSTILNASDVSIVNSLFEIKDEFLDDDRFVVVLEGFLRTENCISDLRLHRALRGYNYLFICSDDGINCVIGGLGKVFKRDLQVLDFELLQSCLYGDVSQQSSNRVISDSREYAESVKESELPNNVKVMADNYLASLERIELLEERVEKQMGIVEELTAKNAILLSDNKKWFDGCTVLVDRARKLNVALEKYEAIYTRDIYNKVNLNSYPNRPTIVYLKVFTEFSGLDLLLQTLADSFRIQQDKSAKVVRLYDSSTSRGIRFLPDYYMVLRNHYDVHKVIQSDYLCKSGDYTNLMDRLLQNKYGLNVLIVVDVKDYDDVIFTGSFLQYNLCSEYRKASILGLSKEYSLLNSPEDDWMVWNDVDLSGYSREQAFLKLSSQKIVQKVLTLCEKFRNAI